MASRPQAVLVATVFTVLLLAFLYGIADILLLLFISILFAIYLSAITESLQQRLGAPRWAGLVSAILITVGGFWAIGAVIFPPLVVQTQDLLRALPDLVVSWNEGLRSLAEQSRFAETLLPQLGENDSYIQGFIGEIGGYFRGAVPVVFSGVQFFIHLFAVLAMGIYLALRPGLYRDGFVAVIPTRHRDLARDILEDLGRTLKAWIGGQILAMIVLGLLTWIGLILLDVPYALAFGVFTGLVAIVPFFGTLVSTLLPALFVIGGSGGATQALLVVLLGVVVHLVEANFVAPMIMEKQVHLPPVLSILSVLIMGHLLHIVGIIVAVPVLATVIVVTRRIYVHQILEGRTFRRAVRDRPLELRLRPGDGVLVNPVAYEQSVPALFE
ncbi:MAG: AI-2E family transporter [Longimicrobiales bacterium]